MRTGAALEEYARRNRAAKGGRCVQAAAPPPVVAAVSAPAGAVGVPGDDGFVYFTCSECDGLKMGALFLPSELESCSPMCRACMGEISVKSTKPRKPGTATKAGYLNVTLRRTSTPIELQRTSR